LGSKGEPKKTEENKMKAKRKTAKTKRPNLKVRDLKSAKDPRGGRKAGKEQQSPP
jgi:hypothetical protein